jgi:hypothetical protein
MKNLFETDVKRACIMYHTDTDASKALGTSNDRFKRTCREFGLETPTERFNRETVERRKRQTQYKTRRATILLPARHIPYPVRSSRNKNT